MTLEAFTATLVADAEAVGNTDLINTILAAARLRVQNGGGTMANLTQSGINGKTFTQVVQFSPLEVIQACRNAIAQIAGTDEVVSSTRPDFRCLDR